MNTKTGYRPPEFKNEISLPLSRNESQSPIVDLGGQLAGLSTDFVSRYPSHQELQTEIGKWIGIDDERIVITAGGDESIDRVMRLALSERKSVVTHAPTFEMVDIYARNYGGVVNSVTWMTGDFPTEQLISKIDDDTAVVVITSPNNPTGGIVPPDEILKVAAAANKAGIQLLVDNAYIEFADEDPTDRLVATENLIVVRTFSKAWGLAGLRVGYLIAPTTELASTIRNSSGPFPVSAVSLELARKSLVEFQPEMKSQLGTIKKIRNLLSELVSTCGGQPLPSQGNFVLAEFANAEVIWEGLAGHGVGIRKFVNNSLLTNHLRLTCPVTRGDYLRLAHALCDVTGSDFDAQKVAIGAAFDPVSCESEIPSAGTIKPSNADDSPRMFQLARETKETKIEIELNLDGTGKTEIATGIGFLDHMLTALTFHSRMDLKLKCDGDLHVDDHHTAEDCALALGSAIDQALGPRKGIQRFGFAYAPLDEALARTVIDLSGRPWPEVHLHLEREMVGTWACENIVHFFQSLAMSLKCSLHVDVLRGTNDHHRVEAAFKSCAKALREALTRASGDVPSTKGVL